MKDYQGKEVLEHRNEIIAKAIRCLKEENDVYKDEKTGLEGYSTGATENPREGSVGFILYEINQKRFYFAWRDESEEEYKFGPFDLTEDLDYLRDYVLATDEEDEFYDNLLYADEKERLLKEAFDENGLAYWESDRSIEKVTYSFVKKEKGAEVQSVELDLRDMKAEMQSKYAKLKQSISDLDEYLLHEYGEKDIYPGEAEVSNTMTDIIRLAGGIDCIDTDAYFIESEEPWGEVREYFDEGWTYIGD